MRVNVSVSSQLYNEKLYLVFQRQSNHLAVCVCLTASEGDVAPVCLHVQLMLSEH